MGELTNQENLQPSLLDRLIDDHPDQISESRDKRVLSMRRLKDIVVRDLGDLLNSLHFQATHNLDKYEYVKQSVVNYGVPGLTGFTIHNLEAYQVERDLKAAILQFEPRILRHTLVVKIIKAEDKMNNRSLMFHIEGQIWALPVPISLLLTTQVDLETGSAAIK